MVSDQHKCIFGRRPWEVYSKVFNVYLHPLYTLAILQFIERGLLYLIVGLLTIELLPLVPAYVGYRIGYADFDYSERKKRIPIFIVAAASYALGYFIFGLLGARLHQLLALHYVVSTVLILLLTLFDKVSVHVSSFVIPGIFLVCYVSTAFAPILVIFTLLTGYARVCLGAHTTRQVVEGAVLPLVSIALLNALL